MSKVRKDAIATSAQKPGSLYGRIKKAANIGKYDDESVWIILSE